MRAFCAKAESLEKKLFRRTRVAVPSRLSRTYEGVRQTWYIQVLQANKVARVALLHWASSSGLRLMS